MGTISSFSVQIALSLPAHVNKKYFVVQAFDFQPLMQLDRSGFSGAAECFDTGTGEIQSRGVQEQDTLSRLVPPNISVYKEGKNTMLSMLSWNCRIASLLRDSISDAYIRNEPPSQITRVQESLLNSLESHEPSFKEHLGIRNTHPGTFPKKNLRFPRFCRDRE